MTYKLMSHAVTILLFFAFMAAIVQAAKWTVPADFTQAFVWSLKQKKFLVPALMTFLLLSATLMGSGSLLMTARIAWSQGTGAYIVGSTQEKWFCVDPERPEVPPREHVTSGPFTIYDKEHYPGQNFREAFRGQVFMRLPWEEQSLTIPHHVAFYLFLNFMVFILLVLAWGATAWLLMQHAAELKAIPHPPGGPALAALFHQRTGFTLPWALGILAIIWIGLGIANSFLDDRFEPLWERLRASEKTWKERILSKARPGAVLKGRIVQKESFVVQGQTPISRSSDDWPRKESTLSVRHLAYLVEFRDLAPFPVYVSIVENGESEGWSEAERVRIGRKDALADSKTPAGFTVQDDLTIALAP